MYAICKLNKIICAIPQPSLLHHPSPTSFPTLLLFPLSATSLTSIIPSSSLQLLQSYPSITPLHFSLSIFPPSSSFLYLFLQPISYYFRIYKFPYFTPSILVPHFYSSLLPLISICPPISLTYFTPLSSSLPHFIPTSILFPFLVSPPFSPLFPSLILSPCLHHSLILFPHPFHFYLHSIPPSITFPPPLHSNLHYIPTSITFPPPFYSPSSSHLPSPRLFPSLPFIPQSISQPPKPVNGLIKICLFVCFETTTRINLYFTLKLFNE